MNYRKISIYKIYKYMFLKNSAILINLTNRFEIHKKILNILFDKRKIKF